MGAAAVTRSPTEKERWRNQDETEHDTQYPQVERVYCAALMYVLVQCRASERRIMTVDVRAWFIEQLKRLRALSGSPSLRQLHAIDSSLSTSTVNALLNGTGAREPNWDHVEAFIRACVKFSSSNGRSRSAEVAAVSNIELWHVRHALLVEWLEREAKDWPSLPAQAGRKPVAAPGYRFRTSDSDLDEAWTTRGDPSARQPTAYVLSGNGGVGKSQVAAAFVTRLWEHKRVDVAVWVGGSSRESIIAGFAAAAEQILGLAINDSEAAAARFLEWLREPGRSWVVVIDDITEPNAVNGLWPPHSPTGMTIATSRHRGAAMTSNNRHLIEVKVFDPEVSSDYLAEAMMLPPNESAAATALAVELGHLPLALAHAVAFMRDFELSCEEYLRRFRDRKTKLDSLFPTETLLPDGYDRTIAATWTLSIEQANNLHPKKVATPLMRVAALFDPNGAPQSFFSTEAVVDYIAKEAAAPDPSLLVHDGLRTLARLSLADLDPTADVMLVHALVQRAVLEQTDASVLAETVTVAADAAVTVWRGASHDDTRRSLLWSNIESLISKGTELLVRNFCHPLLFQYVQGLGDYGLYGKAASLAGALAETASGQLGGEHADTLQLRLAAMYWTGMTGAHEQAEAMASALLRDAVSALGNGHELTLLCKLYAIRWSIEDSSELSAVDRYSELVAELTELLGPHHDYTLRARNNMANAYGHAGEYATAAAASERLLADRMELLGPDHPDTLLTRFNLAKWTGLDGRFEPAIEALTELLPHYTLIKGSRHPLTLYTQVTLADFRGHTGDVGATVAELQILAERFAEVFGTSSSHSIGVEAKIAAWSRP